MKSRIAICMNSKPGIQECHKSRINNARLVGIAKQIRKAFVRRLLDKRHVRTKPGAPTLGTACTPHISKLHHSACFHSQKRPRPVSACHHGTETRPPGAWAACAVPSQEPLPVARTQRRMLLELHYTATPSERTRTSAGHCSLGPALPASPRRSMAGM